MMSVPKTKIGVPSTYLAVQFSAGSSVYTQKKRYLLAKKEKIQEPVSTTEKELGGWENRKLNRTRNLV